MSSPKAAGPVGTELPGELAGPPSSEDGLAPPVPGYGLPPDVGARVPSPPMAPRAGASRPPVALYVGIAVAFASALIVAVLLVVFAR